MKNRKIKTIALATLTSLVGVMMVTGCVNKPTPSPEPPVVEEEEFLIQVTAPSAVSYSLSKEKAKKGEEVTLTITEVAPGVTIKTVVLNNKTTLESSDGKTYKFEMPNRSVSILITAAVEGDLVIEGDLTAKLEPVSGQEGLYVAKNVKANGSSERSKFSWVIMKDGEKTACKVLDLDETKSFADINMLINDTYKFEVANGYTYDFYYDSNSAECPCYIQRVGFSKLPTTVSQLEDLFITSPTVRSEYAVYPDNYVGAHFEINDRSTEDVINQVYDWNLYENNLSFATVESTSGFDDDETMYVYKKYDTAKQQYQFVDTYPYKSGDKIINDDRYRPTDNNYGPQSGTYNVINEDDYGHRYDINQRSVERNVKTSAHMPNYFVEREVMYAYRVGFQSDDGVSYSNISIVPSEVETDGSATITLNTVKEYDTTKTGSTSGTIVQQGYKYTLTIGVNARSEITSLNYKEVLFDAESWDFSSHTNKATAKGTTIKTIKANYTYGAKKSGTPNYGDFNINDYFVTSLSGIQLWNDKVDDPTAKAEGKSIVGIDDTISLYDCFAYDFNKLMKNKKYYSPATALDFWQYTPISSSDETVIAKLGNNASYEMTALNEGQATITIGSHVEGHGPTTTVDIKVIATSLVRDFFMTEYEKDSPVEGAEFTTLKAGGTFKYKVNVFPYDAALKYHAVSDSPTYLKVVSADNAGVLVLDASGAKDITTNQKVHVTMEAEYQWMDNAHTKRFEPTVFTFTIVPGDINPAGKWTHQDTTNFPNTYVTFTTTTYEGSVETGMEGAYQGVLHDDVFIDGQLKSSDNYNFYYTYKDGQLKVRLYEIDMQDASGWSTNPSDYYLDFIYDAANNRYLVYLGEIDEFDPESGLTYYYSIIGGSNSGYDDSDTLAYAPFVKA